MRQGGLLKDIDTGEKERLYQTIKERPHQVSNYKQLASLMRADGQYSSALKILKKALSRYPDDKDVKNHIGKTHYEAGAPDKALRVYRDVIREHLEDSIAYEKLDKICRETGKIEQAISAYRKIKKGNKLKERSYQRLHFLLVEKVGDLDGGAKNLLAAIRDFGPNYRRCKDLGRIFARRCEWKRAANYYKMALDFKKDDSNLIGLLGWALVDSGRLREAEDCFKRIADSFQGMVSLAELYLRTERLDKAEKQLDISNKRYPDNSRVSIGYAELHLKRGDLKKARKICEDALQRVPSYFMFEQAHAHHVLAEVYQRLGRAKEASYHGQLAKALKEGPDTYSALIRLAEGRIVARKLDEAEAFLGRLLYLYPDNTRALVDRCEIEILRKEPRQAVHFGEEGLRAANPKYREERLKGHILLKQAYSLLKDGKNSQRHGKLADAMRDK